MFGRLLCRIGWHDLFFKPSEGMICGRCDFNRSEDSRRFNDILAWQLREQERLKMSPIMDEAMFDALIK